MSHKKWKKIILYIIAIFTVMIVDFPVVFMFITSFKPISQIMVPNLKFSFTPTLENYKMLVTENFPLFKYLLNSFIISLCSAVIAIALSLPASYGISRFKEKKEGTDFWILSIRMAPPVVFALPMFLILKFFNIIDTRIGLILTYFTFTIPLAVWILKAFMMEIPKSLEEAAMLDGATRSYILLRIITPLMKPGIVSVFIIDFVFAWNEFFFALILTLDKATTLTVGTARFITGYSIYWGSIAGASMIAAIPMIILMFFVQKFLVRGLTMGAVK